MADKDIIIGRAINLTGMIGVSAGIVLMAFGIVLLLFRRGFGPSRRHLDARQERLRGLHRRRSQPGTISEPRKATAAITTTRPWVAEPTMTSLAFAGGGSR